jgi:hypothetical protein
MSKWHRAPKLSYKKRLEGKYLVQYGPFQESFSNILVFIIGIFGVISFFYLCVIVSNKNFSIPNMTYFKKKISVWRFFPSQLQE